MRKKIQFIITILLSLIICFSFIIFKSYAVQQIRIYVNGEAVASSSRPSPMILDNHVYVPVRAIAEALGAEVNWDGEKQVVNIDSNIKLIASIPKEKIYLYSFNEDEGFFKGLILGINGVNKLFDWKNCKFLSEWPELQYIDLTDDTKKELAIRLFKGGGTGFIDTEMHIVNPENFVEYQIENPLNIIAKNVEVKIISKKEAEVKINNTVVASINLDNIPWDRSGGYPDIISQLYYDDAINYYLEENTLKAKVPVRANPMEGIGNIIIDYSFQDGQFKDRKISFGHLFKRES